MRLGCIDLSHGVLHIAAAIVAGHAAGGRHNGIAVAELGGSAGPGRCGVAEGAVGRALHVGGRFCIKPGDGSAMAGLARAIGLAVVKSIGCHRLPDGG